MATEETTITPDDIFDVLSSPRRRYVLYHLRRNGPTDLMDLTEAVASWEYEIDPDELTSQQRKRVYVSLYQTHIPKMDALEIIDYDQDSGVIELTSRAAAVDRYLTTEDTGGPRWQLAYLGMGMASVLLLATVVFDLSVFALIPDFLAIIGIVIGFSVIAIAHFRYQRRAGNHLPVELRYGER